MTYYLWCPLCGQVAVYRRAEPCTRCVGEVAALVDPVERPPVQPRQPLGLRVLSWISGRMAA